MKLFTVPLLFLVYTLACSRAGTSGEATPTTAAANAEFAKNLTNADQQDFQDAKRGLIARPTGKIISADGATVLKDFDAYNFVSGDAPATVNPSLWRQAQLNANFGLYKVTDGVYQLRGFDIANMTIVEGKKGWIIIDPLTARETAAFALAFAREKLGAKPVTGLIFTHAHADHFGGVLGVVSKAEVRERKLPIVAPHGFMEEATSENILVGLGMARRSTYQFGRNLPRSAKGNIDTGLGKDLVYGTVGILEPNRIVENPTQEMRIDGVNFIFHNVPNAECPAELTFSIPGKKLYDGAENLSHTMHNLLPIRGAKVRDALRWSNYLNDALEHAQDANVYIGSHNWPVWGNANIRRLITMHRDVYKYTHDQTVRLINSGYTQREIADMVKLPKSLSEYFGSRGYYGDLRHNVKAVYQFYLGAYDGNPANLNPLPPQESAQRYVELLGGVDKVVAAAQAAFDKGEYRWAAELLNHAVFAAPKNPAAKELLAKTYDQLGYVSEAATWRNAYLSGAHELRQGMPDKAASRVPYHDLLMETPMERFLEAMCSNLNGPDAEGKNLKINLVFTDIGQTFVLWIENAVLHFKRATADNAAAATLKVTKSLFVKMASGAIGLKDALLSDDMTTSGSKMDLIRFFKLIDKPTGNFHIVTR